MRRWQWFAILAGCLLLGEIGRAQVALSVDRLDGSEPGTPAPPNRVVVDVFANVATSDTWVASGLRALTANGATLVYALNGAVINPGTQNRFTTSFSRPLGRDVDERFNAPGAASSGRYDPSGPTAVRTASEINIAWFSSPPATSMSPSVDGYIARIVIDISAVPGIDPSTIVAATGAPPPGSIPLLVSAPSSGSAPLGTVGATFDVPAISGLNWNVHALPSAPPVDFRRVMITEVSWGDPDGLEITNFSDASVDVAGWTVRWKDASSDLASAALNTVIAPGEVVVVGEGSAPASLAPGTPYLSRFTAIPTSGSSFAVALRDASGTVVDEVRVADPAGSYAGFALGGTFRGSAQRAPGSSLSGDVGVERFWGLDSDGGTDWTGQSERSFGRQNRNSGPLGLDPAPLASVVISEIDDDPDYLELYNRGPTPVELRDWFLVFSSGQGSAAVYVRPFPGSRTLSPSEFIVIGDGAAAPPELPNGVAYVDLQAIAGGNIPLTSVEYQCVLYDALGRAVDAVRATRTGTELVANHPRLPTPWSAFTGAARRLSQTAPGASSLARTNLVLDTNTGQDWRSSFARTMGSSNGSFVGEPGHGEVIDVRLDEGVSPGNGLTFIINAGPARAGFSYSIAVGVGHQFGDGPFFGLGADALFNYLNFYGAPLFTGVLDANGSYRFDFDPGIFPNGVDTDDLFLLQDPTGLLVARTLVIAWDT